MDKTQMHAEIAREREDAARYRHIRSTAFRETDKYSIWLRFAAIEQHECPSHRLTEEWVDELVDREIERHAAMKDSQP